MIDVIAKLLSPLDLCRAQTLTPEQLSLALVIAGNDITIQSVIFQGMMPNGQFIYTVNCKHPAGHDELAIAHVGVKKGDAGQLIIRVVLM